MASRSCSTRFPRYIPANRQVLGASAVRPDRGRALSDWLVMGKPVWRPSRARTSNRSSPTTMTAGRRLHTPRDVAQSVLRGPTTDAALWPSMRDHERRCPRTTRDSHLDPGAPGSAAMVALSLARSCRTGDGVDPRWARGHDRRLDRGAADPGRQRDRHHVRPDRDGGVVLRRRRGPRGPCSSAS
jgi:hypothetical protein